MNVIVVECGQLSQVVQRDPNIRGDQCAYEEKEEYAEGERMEE